MIRRCLVNSCGSSSGSSPEGGIDRSAILTASLPYVKEYGWTNSAITHGAQSLELPGVVHGLFPRGGVELADHFESLCNQELVEFLQRSTSGEQPFVLRVVTAVVCEELPPLPLVTHTISVSVYIGYAAPDW